MWDTFYTEIQSSVSKKDYAHAEELTRQAFALYPEKVDAIYLLTRVFREESYHTKAWEFYLLGSPHADEEHKSLFLYEKTILNYYVGTPKEEALLDFLEFYNNHMQISYDNLVHYTFPYTCQTESLPFPPIGDFLPTSTSMLPTNDGFLLNIRYVNYRIQSDSSYLMVENGLSSGNHPLRTRNFTVRMTKDFKQNGPMDEMIPDEPPRHIRNIKGIEDIRLFYDEERIRFTAASCEYSHDGNIQQIIGTYGSSLEDIQPLYSPKNSSVEKNWIPTGQGSFIYSWNPFVLGILDGPHFKETLRYDTPPFFEHIRGSSTLFFYEGDYYCIVHCMIDSRPRKYYHPVVRLNTDFRIQAYSLPLFFKTNHIEYTLGMVIQEGILYSIVSQNDCNPILVKIEMSSLKWIAIQTHAME